MSETIKVDMGSFIKEYNDSPEKVRKILDGYLIAQKQLELDKVKREFKEKYGEEFEGGSV